MRGRDRDVTGSNQWGPGERNAAYTLQQRELDLGTRRRGTPARRARWSGDGAVCGVRMRRTPALTLTTLSSERSDCVCRRCRSATPPAPGTHYRGPFCFPAPRARLDKLERE